MTNKIKKAIEQLERISNSLASIGETADYTNIAIQALEQQLCDNCVSKEEVNKLVDELTRAISDERCCMSRGRSTASIIQDIIDLPTVTPQQTELEEEYFVGYTDGYIEACKVAEEKQEEKRTKQ